MRADVLRLQLIYGLDLFQVAIHHLRGQDRSVFGEETGLRLVRASERSPAVPGVLLEALIDFYLAAFLGLLLIQGKHTVLGVNLLQAKRPQVLKPLSKETSATDEQRHPVVSVPAHAVDAVKEVLEL